MWNKTSLSVTSDVFKSKFDKFEDQKASIMCSATEGKKVGE